MTGKAVSSFFFVSISHLIGVQLREEKRGYLKELNRYRPVQSRWQDVRWWNISN